MKIFNYSNLEKSLVGAEVKEGDYIESVSFGEFAFSDGWEVVKVGGKLGVYWGYKKEFTPFEHFASRCIFTIREEQTND